MGSYRTFSQEQLEEMHLKQEGPWVSLNEEAMAMPIRGLSGYTGEDEEVVIPGNEPLQEIMFGCEKIKKLTIPANLDDIANSVISSKTNNDPFHSFEHLEEIQVQEGNPSFSSKDGALYSKDGRTLLRCPRGWKGVFTLPPEVREIKPSAFYGCSEIEDIKADGNSCYMDENGMLFDADGKELIYAFPFKGKVVIPARVTEIRPNALEPGRRFRTDQSKVMLLEEIKVKKGNPVYLSEDGVLYTRKRQLVMCPPAKKGDCVILDGTEEILDGAFLNCADIHNILIPQSVQKIGDRSFNGCSAANIFVDGANSCYRSEEGILFSKDGTTLVYFPENRTGEYHIPGEVTEIVRGAFSNNKLDTFYISKKLVQKWMDFSKKYHSMFPGYENEYKWGYLGISDDDLERVRVILV